MVSPKAKTFLSALVLSLLAFVPLYGQNVPATPADKSLPEKVGEYRAAGSIESLKDPSIDPQIQGSGVTSTAGRLYVSKAGERFLVLLATTTSDSAAYAEVTQKRKEAEGAANAWKVGDADVGTSAVSFSGQNSNYGLAFFKGRTFVLVRNDKAHDAQSLINFGKSLADTLDKGSGEIPVLVKHLPDWQSMTSRVLYAVEKDTLKNTFSDQAILDAVSFEGGTEVVIGNYGDKQLAIVEFNTASLATDNDHRITAKIQELKTQGQPVPSAYRRVGNYAVFVFDAANEQSANQLIDQVKYQQVVQWLGQDPFSYEQATREFTETTLGVFVAVVKTSGLALVVCLTVGGFFGALLFSFRRARQRAREAYSDSDAMLRLNLDELTPESDPARLLGRGN